jgi:hypothetical protein
MTNQDLIQAVKACIILDLEEEYNHIEQLAYFATSLDERVIILERLRDTYGILNNILQEAIDKFVAFSVADQVKSLRRDLTKEEELIVEQVVKENPTLEIVQLVKQAKELLNIK